MRKFLFLIIFVLQLVLVTDAFAYRSGQSPKYDDDYSQDAHGRWTRTDNLYNDSDGDGYSNYYDSSDSNPYKF